MRDASAPNGALPRSRASTSTCSYSSWWSAGLVVVNFLTGGPWWVLWILLGWGIGVLAHGLAAMGRLSSALANWEERKIKRLMDEDRR